MNETVSTGVEKARTRAQAIDGLELREAKPECFQLWFSGALRPYRVTEEINRAGFTREDLASALGAAVEALQEGEAGNVYPSWLRVCQLSAAIDIPLEQLLDEAEPQQPDISVGTNARDAMDAVNALMKASFHPAVVGPIVSSAFGLTGKGITREIMDAASAGKTQAIRDRAAEVAEHNGLGNMARSLRSEADSALAVIRGGYEGRLNRFRHELFAAVDKAYSLPAEVGDTDSNTLRVTVSEVRKITAANPPVASMGPVPAMSGDPVQFQFVGTFTDQAVMFSDSTREGTVLTISVAALDEFTQDRVAVPSDAARVWLHAILGDSWVEHMVERGALSGIDGTLSTEYYDIFIGPDGKAQPSPVLAP